jgi:hypothetical protein
MGKNMKEALKKINLKDKEYIFGLLEILTKDNLKKV